MYAVEKWIVERNRPIIVLAVYTGDPSHKISVTALAPSSSLSATDAQAEWDKALHHLRRDGARAKETPHGVLMATSLAHFRSDYTIVHIPDGNFLAVREQLYTNINLLRMGCSGRSALTLEEPSDATKDRFICTYHLPEHTQSRNAPITSTDSLPLPPALSKTRSHSQSNSHQDSLLNFNTSPAKQHTTNQASPSASISKGGSSISKSATGFVLGLPNVTHDSTTKSKEKEVGNKTRDRDTFNATVLELVKLIQASLAIFGFYGSPDTGIQPDGVLCDETVDGIRRWIIDIGEPCVGLEPMERIADPVFVSALLSLVLSIRNKLVALGFSHVVPKDPFLQPHIFAYALATYVQSSSSAPSTTPSISQIYPSALHAHSSSTSSTLAQSPSHGFTYAHFGAHLLPPQLYYHNHSHPGAATSSSITLSRGGKIHMLNVVLTRELVEVIEAAYESKVRSPEGRGGVRRGLRGKLEDLTRVGGESDDDGAVERRGMVNVGDGGADGRIGGTGATAGGGVGLATSGGQLLSGIGKLVGASGGSHGGPGAVLEGTHDLEAFVRMVIGKGLKGKGKGKAKEKKREIGDATLGYGIYGREKEKDASVAVSVRALWSGGVATVVRLRQREMEREMRGEKEKKTRRRGIGYGERALSDGDLEDSARNDKSDGGTEEESDMVVGPGVSGFGPMMWGEKVQKKIESWTGITRKRGHASLDLPAPPSIPEVKVTRAQTLPVSPTLQPVMFADDGDDDDLLSSGQVSPIDNQPNSFNVLHDDRLLDTSLANAKAERERKVLEFDQKRPWGSRVSQSRISSWADPVSARNILDGEDEEVGVGVKRKKDMRQSRLAEGSVVEEEEEDEGEFAGDWPDEVRETPRRTLMYDAQRRRSFHDLPSLRGMRMQNLEQMRVDVELCGQLLIMARREEHLRNVMACLQVLTKSLSDTNALLREDYQNHLPFISSLDEHTRVISDIDAENARADKTSQATHTLRYESEQFQVPDLWHTATLPRQKVLELREKVFGSGGRRLPPGVHGVHGRFNRLQWTLDGQERLVDYLGRTDSEAEEESIVDPHSVFILPPEEEEEDLVEHPGIKPMWLLRFFTSWGARWGAPAPSRECSDNNDAAKSNGTAVVEDSR